MHMSFWLSYKIDELLFPSLQVSSVLGLIAACFVVFLLAATYEDLKVLLVWIKLCGTTLKCKRRAECMPDESVVVEDEASNKSRRVMWFLLEFGVYMLEFTLGYLIMLLVMTYNGYFLISVVLGSAIGYFLFGQTLMNLKLKTSKFKLPCEKCSKVNPSTTASTEAIAFSESVNNFVSEPPCCSLEQEVEIHLKS